MDATNMDIDDSLYSRQRYVLDDDAMRQMARSSVFLSGLGGLGVEIAKNIVLAGVKLLNVHDTKSATIADLGTQFFLREDDVGRNRAVASLERLKELNPYVRVRSSTEPLNHDTDLVFLKEYQCVVVTDCPLALQCKLDSFCHSQGPPIKFISTDVRGVFCRIFCDFGERFEVLDPTGEAPKEFFIQSISQSNPGVVVTMDNRAHGLETGDRLTFKEVHGMTSLNGCTHTVTVLSPYMFSIGDTSGLPAYLHGGMAKQVKVPKMVHFESLEKQLVKPTCLVVDYSKPEAPLQIHLALLALEHFEEQHKRLPTAGCADDVKTLCSLAEAESERLCDKVSVERRVVECAALVAGGQLAALTAALGGVVGQEVLKALTGKFGPIQQWLYFDAMEVVGNLENVDSEGFKARGDRYDALRLCVGEAVCEKLHKLSVFMVGCGAIGCEMLKNMALLGVGTDQEHGGLVTITDPDLIEKSNLNRQFLFRSHHIQKPKSTTGATVARDINPQLHVEPRLDRVGPATEATFSDDFLCRQSLVLNALDNVEARRYMDSRCVSNQRPLIDSGTMGTKGHVEVVVPHLTESYNSQRDPLDEEVPFCTLKSFPNVIEHTIQWARDKFESAFTHKPSIFSKFWESQRSPKLLLERLHTGESPEGAIQAVKLLSRRCTCWEECVMLARVKFEKYFNHKAKQLLHAFPLDTRLKDGSLFWQSPKRPPTPVIFDPSIQLHFSFVVSTARLFAEVCGIPYTEQSLSKEFLLEKLESITVPEFRPSSKQIETDDGIKKVELAKLAPSGEEESQVWQLLDRTIKEGAISEANLRLKALEFEKDDDCNAHVDFILAASNLRACMYSIDLADRPQTKRIAGRIIPAIATTTAAVSGLVALELIKVAQGLKLEDLKNCFLNLGIPVLLLSEPAPVKKTPIRGDLSFTIWDKWEIHGSEDFTLQDFIRAVKEKYGVEPTMVVQGVKMVYVPIMPGHSKRLKQTMNKLLKQTERRYVDLTLSFAPETPGEDDLPGPPVRYFLCRAAD
ncbi:ubiquitin-like modifier-activating enzyme 6 [Lethenteron reissneri]|uniref:ubiquitin-like modifier-activating enzyme 6 n=1 Tax=Lethenteron reissneri TaxID=7753 RepID=UPI002AB63CB5|nr:ubiquitin-like modifier-activating enzyme 6 [Lethenteron reissneri]